MRCLINFAKGGNYAKGQKRLEESLQKYATFDYFLWNEEEQIGCPPHSENPYAFKIYAFNKALELGYSSILWIDASVWLIGNIDHIFDEIEQDGYIMQYAGHDVGTWTNDSTLDYFGIERDKAMDMLMYGNAGFLGLDFKKYLPCEFFSKWENSMLDGMFKGAWTNDNKTESQDERCKGHRHDMSCGSIIANELDMKYKSGDEILQYTYGKEYKPNNKTIVMLAEGV